MRSDPPRDERDDGSAAIAAIAAALWSIPLFNACGPAEIDAASRLLRWRTGNAGTEFDPFELTTHSFLVVRGHAVSNGGDGTATRLSPGDLFGLLRFAVADSETAAVVALTDLQLLVADVDASARLLRLDGVAYALVHGAATRRRARVNRDDISDAHFGQ